MISKTKLNTIKELLGYSKEDTAADNMLLVRIAAAEGLVDLPMAQIESELGSVLVALIVNDLGNVIPGEVKSSPAFNIIYEKLCAQSLMEAQNENI